MANTRHSMALDIDEREPTDYVAEHPVDIANIPAVAPRTGHAPHDAVKDLLARSDRLLYRWAMNDRHIDAVNDPVTPEGATLLHIAAKMYALSTKAYERRAAMYYAAATEALLAAGADPHATMRRASAPGPDGIPGAMDDTPASVCDGCMPPALRQRMLTEAAAGHIEVGDAGRITRMIADRHRKRGAVARRERHVDGLAEQGSAWIARAPTGEIVARVEHTGGDSRFTARSDAASALRRWRRKQKRAA